MSHIHIKIPKVLMGRILLFCGGIMLLGVVAFSFYRIAYADKILPRVQIGTVELGSLTRDDAREVLSAYEARMEQEGLVIELDGKTERIELENIGFRILVEDSVNRAWSVGREGSWVSKFKAQASAPLTVRFLQPKVEINHESLENEIATIAELYDNPRKDIRFAIEGKEVGVRYDTKAGKIVPRNALRERIVVALSDLNTDPVALAFENDLPRVSPATVEDSKKEAERIIASPLTLVYQSFRFVVTEEKIGSWVVSTYEENRLVPALDEEQISAYVTELATGINTAPQDVRVLVIEGKVIDFIPPRAGRVLEEDKTVVLITEALLTRRDGTETTQEFSLPVTVKKPVVDETAANLGITELVGAGATTFKGSPPNRIHNIKNGVKFLTGILIAPGEEFSTLKALGKISNTTGYLPELVIKQNRTIPEYGGGLCQVSTTLFRAILNAGLPISARRNHSYRVSYYEKDAEGNVIGPGLDATIYNPNPDFRFVNDTGSTLLIQGRVEGDVITFELYGTKDDRIAEVDGPHTLSTIGAGPAIYAETDTLKKGVTKRIEIAHPGGSAIATYKVTYPDGRINEQVFKSYYRPWPARYLVGTRE